MPYSGGTHQRVHSWIQDRDAGIKIQAFRMDTDTDDISVSLSQCILKDGTQTITANIPFNNNRITNLGDPVNDQDAATRAWVNSVLPIVSPTFLDGDFRVQSTADPTKQMAFNVAAVAPGQTRTFDAPDLDGELLLSTSAKVSSTVFTVFDNADNTKQLQFNLVGIGTGATRNIKMPDDDVDLAPNVSFVTPNGALVSFGGLSIVEGDLVYGSGVDTVQRLAKGAAAQILRMNGAATAPEWFTSTAIEATGSPTAQQYARFVDGETIEGRSPTETRGDLGLATTDSPEFAGINLGHPTDTLLTRDSAGIVAADGKKLANLEIENQDVTGGAGITEKDLGVQNSGNLTLDMSSRGLQKYTNGGAHSLQPGSVTGTCVVLIENNASAGAINFSSWRATEGTTDLTTTDGDAFMAFCTVFASGVNFISIRPLQ